MFVEAMYITKNGLKKLQKELDYLINERRPALAKEIESALNDDGPEDNFEYDKAREEMMLIEKRILELTDAKKSAKVIVKKRKGSLVGLGSTVVVEIENEKVEFTIVGSYEADPMKGLISNESPLGKALLGSSEGDVVSVSTEEAKSLYKVISIK